MLAAAPLPVECELPPLRDVSALRGFAQKTGTFSAGLDAVQTWCFDASGAYSAGRKSKRDGGVELSEMPVLECAKAMTSCQKAKAELSFEQRKLLAEALDDLKRPYVGKRYVPKRSGLDERPDESGDCALKSRNDLFRAAQARMDFARLVSQTQNEYQNYRSWLNAESLSCARMVRERDAKASPFKKGLTYDTPVDRQGGEMRLEARVADAGTTPVLVLASKADAGGAALSLSEATKGDAGGVGQAVGAAPSSSKDTVLAVSSADGKMSADNAKSLSPAEKWKRFAEVEKSLSLDVDYVSGFLASRELRECKCARVPAEQVLKRYAGNEPAAQVDADDLKNTRCELCFLEAYSSWKRRSASQCALMSQLSDYEIQVLQKSDDAYGLPPRCIEAAKAKRGQKPGAVVEVAKPATIASAGETSVSKGGFLVTKTPAAVDASPQATPATEVSKVVTVPANIGGTSAATPVVPATSAPDSFVRAKDYAPLPEREEGRLYLRIFTSAACVAEVLPGPIQARTGDVLPLPIGLKGVTVSGPCGGLAEVYWGRQEKPKVSEVFGKGQPLKLQFEAP